MKPAKIKLLESAFASYTGYMSGVEFKNGESIGEVPFVDQQRICSIMKAQTIEGVNVSGASALAMSRELTSFFALENEKKADLVIDSPRGEDGGGSNDEIIRYTRAELEAVADDGGIAGLRDIGNRFDVKATSIEKMIDAILAVAGE